MDDVLSYFGRKVGAVICDLSPKVTGNWSVDHARQISLNYDCTKIMDKVFKTEMLFSKYLTVSILWNLEIM